MTIAIIQISNLRVEHHESGFGIGVPCPRISWSFSSTEKRDWTQASYEIVIDRGGQKEQYKVSSSQSILVPWPSTPLRSREVVDIQVISRGIEGSVAHSSPCTIEAGLFHRDDWKGQMISSNLHQPDQPKTPFVLSKTFKANVGTSRLYATAYGLYKVELNGKAVGDQALSPGWQSYAYHLNYQIYDVSDLLVAGDNTIEVTVGEGWYAGRLGSTSGRNHFGDRIGFLGQLEVGGIQILTSDDSWDVSPSPIITSEIYDGETYDSNPVTTKSPHTQGRAEALPFPSGTLTSSDAPPVRRVGEVRAVERIKTPSGKVILDFGQNLVGWVRLEKNFSGEELVLRFAEVLEHGELGVRPLRGAEATDRVLLGGDISGWEPSFTFHGFRYMEVSGADCDVGDITAIVLSTDMRRTGTFHCSHEMLNKLHDNVIWGLRGNFLSVPTDCPQRDERLGWTADIQVFGPTASFLFDTAGFLSGWLRDLHVETLQYGGLVPEISPYIPLHTGNPRPHAIWGDTAVVTPWDLYNRFDDKEILAKQFESMCAWLDKGIPRQMNGLWEPRDSVFGDWLDPKSPPAFPAHAATDPFLVSNAYLLYTTSLAAKSAGVIGRDVEAQRYAEQYDRLRAEFRKEYVTQNGRVVSDTQTGLGLALKFGLLDGALEEKVAVDRLDWLIRWESFKITTGFAGTSIILDTLAAHGKLTLAYRMLQEKDCPSWLYPVSMGATTIWERWDSMLPNGDINPGQMTSFNHYAYGSVANFMHTVISGLSPLEPGWKKALIKPQPGGTVTSAQVSFESPYGLYEVAWKLEGESLLVKAQVPPNTSAEVVLPGIKETVGSGAYEWKVRFEGAQDWPPKQLKGPTRIGMPNEFVP